MASRPMIVADNVHVNYRVYASGKKLSARDTMVSLKSIRGGRDLTTVPAVRGVSFTASEGESIGVVGHNGSGKSTLFRAMSGLIPPSEGAIYARDRPVLLGVNAALVPELSGENNIKLGLLAMGFSAEEAAARVDEISDFAELNDFIYHPMRTYSSGMAARLKFAIASAKAHSILLIDEALAVGDRRFRTKSEQRISELRGSAGLVMIVSHSAGSLRDSCERVLWIHKGELIADGPSKDVVGEYLEWTKKPGSSAVGAASPTKPKTKNAPAAQTLLTGTGDRPSGSRRSAPATGVTALPDLDDSPRTAARRERYRRETAKRKRRNLTLMLLTGSAILLAVAAGAIIGTLATFADDTSPADPAGQTTPQPTESATATAPEITSFTASTAVAVCETEEDDVELQLNWQIDDAVSVALAAGPTQVDALDNPARSGLSTQSSDYAVAFSCELETAVYTLTAENAEGLRTSAAVTVTRELPEPEPEPVTPVRPVVPDPVETTVPDPDPVESTDPGETPDPDPVETSDPDPVETTEPTPEQTGDAPTP